MKKPIPLLLLCILLSSVIAGCVPATSEIPVSTDTIQIKPDTEIPSTTTPVFIPADIPADTSQRTKEDCFLPALQTITTENAVELELLRTMEIPEYQPGRSSQCSVAFSPDGHLLVGACGNNPVPVWDVQSGELFLSLSSTSGQIVTCDFSPDGRIIACGGFDREITGWDSATGEKIAVLGAHDAAVWDLAFSPDGVALLSCSLAVIDPGSGNGDIRFWDVNENSMSWSFLGITNFTSVSIDPRGSKVAAGGLGGKIEVLDRSTGERLVELTDSAKNIGDLTYSPSGDWLIAGSDDDDIYVWETADYILNSHMSGHSGYVNGVALNPDETILVSGSHDKTVGVWNFAERELLSQLNGHTEMVLRVAINSDGTLIASISWDGTVRLWGVVAEAPAAAVTSTETPIGEIVSFSTEDGIELSGTLFEAGEVAVILAHQGTPGANQRDWHYFGAALADMGYTALAFDFRGIGKSGGRQDRSKLDLDVYGALQFLQHQSYNEIFCIGASMGGTACIKNAINGRQLAGVITLGSAMITGYGQNDLRISLDELSSVTLPKLFITAEDDSSLVVGDTTRMYENSPEPKELCLLPGSAHGTDLFDTDVHDELTDVIIAFLTEITR